MFPCLHCRNFTFSLLQGAAGPERLHCHHCGLGTSRASLAKPVGVVLAVIIALFSLALALFCRAPAALCGLSLSLVVGRAYWPPSAHAQLSQFGLCLALQFWRWRGSVVSSNPSIERTSCNRLRLLPLAAHVER